MSINVTVHGNLYKFGADDKMISDFDYSKKQELENRKRLRLEQVRQQSKVLAKNLRNKYEQEKQRQQKCLEECKMKELKLWQQKNIEKLQKEYEQCLKNVGKAHKAAKEYEEEENLHKAKRMAQRAVAIKRGLQAAERLRREQEAKKKKRSINKLKHKTVAVQTECGSSQSDSEASQLLENISISSDDVDTKCKDYIDPDKPFTQYKANASKTILSISSDDDEEIKILSDMTSEENERKRFEADALRKRQPESIDFNYDNPLSEYKSIYSGTGRPFNQVSDHLKKRVDEESTSFRPALAELNNYPVLGNARTLIDKEKLSSLYKSPKKDGSRTTGASHKQANTQFQPSLQRVSNAIDHERRKNPPSIGNQYKNVPAKRPPKAIPSQSRADAALEKQRIQQDYNELTTKLDKLCAEEKHLKAYDIPEYAYSTTKIAKDAQVRQQRLEKAFENVLTQPAVITCPKLTSIHEKPQKKRIGPSINVADTYREKPKTTSKVKPQKDGVLFQSQNDAITNNTAGKNNFATSSLDQDEGISLVKRTSARVAELDRIVNIERLKDLLQKMNEQKELLLHEIQKDQTIPDLQKYKEAIETLELQKTRLFNEKDGFQEKTIKDIQTKTSNPEVKNQEKLEKNKLEKDRIELEKRAQNLQELECRLENEMRKLYKRTKQIEAEDSTKKKSNKGPVKIITQNVDQKNIEITENDSSTTTTSSTTSECENDTNNTLMPAPVKIVIKVNDYTKKSRFEQKQKKAAKPVTEKLTDSIGKVYPKTPAKKSILKKPTIDAEPIPIVDKEEESVIIVDDDTIEEVPPIPKEDGRRSPEVSGESGSTVYRAPPAKIKTEFAEFLNRITRETIEEQKQKNLALESRKTSKNHSVPKTQETIQAVITEKPSKKPVEKFSQENEKSELNPALTYYIKRLLGMSRASIDQLGVSSGSDVTTPNSSVINVSDNVTNKQSENVLNRLKKLKRFIEENNSFINEVEEALAKKQLNGTIEENVSVVENVWKDTLSKKEEEIKKKQSLIKKQVKKVFVSPPKKRISRPCTEPSQVPKTKKVIERPKTSVEPSTNKTTNQREQTYQNSTISSTTRSKSVSPRKQRPTSRKKSVELQQKDRRVRSVSPPTRSLGSPTTVSTGSPSHPKSILKSPRRQLAANINEIIGEVELLRVTGKDEDKIVNKYAELTENCSKRISELANLIERARVDKRMVLELSFTSNDQPNSTEYMDLPAMEAQTKSNEATDGHTSPETMSYPDDQSNKRMTQMRQIGKSRDSGISMSRPVTSSDFRGSTEQVSPETSNDFNAFMKGVPYLKVGNKDADSAEQLQAELRKFGHYLNDLDASMTKLTSGYQKQKSKPPSAIKRYSPQLVEKAQPHELSTIVEAETSATSRLNATQDKQLPLLEEADISEILRPENFPTYDDYILARVNQFTQNGSQQTDILKNLLHSSTNSDKLNYEKFPSLLEGSDLSLIMENLQTKPSQFQDDMFADLSDELKRRKIIDRSLKLIKSDESDGSSTSNGSNILDIKYEIARTVEHLKPVLFEQKHKTPQMEKSPKSPISPRKIKQFETRVMQKTPEKHGEASTELDSTVPKTPEKPKLPHKKRTPSKQYQEESPRRKKSVPPKNLSGFTYLQESFDGKKLQKELTEMGMNWAASTIKRTEQAQALHSSSTSDSSPLLRSGVQKSGSKTEHTDSGQNREPIKPKIGLQEFLRRELLIRSQHSDSSTESSLSSLFLKSLMNISTSTSNSANDIIKRTSTPLQGKSMSTTKSSNQEKSHDQPISDTLFSGESRISSVRGNASSTEKETRTMASIKTPLKPPNIKDADDYASSSTSHSNH